jgi:hypothetical protein
MLAGQRAHDGYSVTVSAGMTVPTITDPRSPDAAGDAQSGHLLVIMTPEGANAV